MKKIIAALLVIAIVLGGTFYGFPGILYSSVTQIERVLAGFETRKAEVQGLDLIYFEGGNPNAETVLLIHGFGGSKENWLRIAGPLNDRYHVIAVDLAGFGDSSKPEAIDYSAGAQAERLVAFLNRIGIDQVHLLGNSMGGHIAALLAARHPQIVLSLGLIDNSGIFSFPLSPVYAELAVGNNPLVIKDQQDFSRLMDLLFVTPPPMPKRLQHYLAEQAIASSQRNARIFAQYLGQYQPLEIELPKVTAPTFILWGKEDRVVDCMSIPVMKTLLMQTRVKVEIIPDCGHVPMVECPAETVRPYLAFLQAQATQSAASVNTP